jgi:hypothetical protein
MLTKNVFANTAKLDDEVKEIDLGEREDWIGSAFWANIYGCTEAACITVACSIILFVSYTNRGPTPVGSAVPQAQSAPLPPVEKKPALPAESNRQHGSTATAPQTPGK